LRDTLAGIHGLAVFADCLAKGIACRDQHRHSGSSSALDTLRRCAIQIHFTFTDICHRDNGAATSAAVTHTTEAVLSLITTSQYYYYHRCQSLGDEDDITRFWGRGWFPNNFTTFGTSTTSTVAAIIVQVKGRE